MENRISKKDLLEFARTLIQEKIKRVELILAELDEGIMGESKSSAGDKHETGRAMLHLEQEKNRNIMAGLLGQNNLISQLEKLKEKELVTPGSVVDTGELVFFIGLGLGRFKVKNREVVFISDQAPLAQKIMGKRKNDVFEFMNKTYSITSLT